MDYTAIPADALIATIATIVLVALGVFAVLYLVSYQERKSKVLDLKAQAIKAGTPVDDLAVERVKGFHNIYVAALLLGTAITAAPRVSGVGPGFCAGKACHAVIETMRGHTLGRVIRTGEPIPNTNIPGLIGGFTGERVLRAPDDGIFHQLADIGARVQAGDVVGEVNGKPMACTIAGVIRGMLADGTPVYKGMKSGDVDPRGELSYCYTASDKAIAIGGGVLQAILEYTGVLSNVTGQNAWEV